MTILGKVDHAKQTVRHRVWGLLESSGAAPPGVHGHIPDFVGKESATARLADTAAWKTAQVIKCNPDRAQLPVRLRALREGKLLYMAVPRLASPKPFYLLDPHALEVPFETAATSTGAAESVPVVGPEEMQPIDLVVCGSVAVSRRDGVRIGKGTGYADLAVALLADADLIIPDTAIATIVHQHQLVDDTLPHAEHDFPVNLAITPDEVLDFGPRRSYLPGIIGSRLRPDQLDQIPALSRRGRTDAMPLLTGGGWRRQPGLLGRLHL